MAEIILVEDDDDDVYFFKTACKNVAPNIKLTTLNNGVDFIDYIHHCEPSQKIFLLDLNMPRMGGLEALSKIRGVTHFKQLIVIIYTTSAREKDITDAYELGAKSYLLKPDSLEKIQELISNTVAYWFEQNAHVSKESS